MKRSNRTTAIKGLRAVSKNLEALIAKEPKPVQSLLQRKIANLTMVWDEFANAHDALFSVVADKKTEDELPRSVDDL